MTVSTTRFFNNNSELFNTLNSELKSLPFSFVAPLSDAILIEHDR